MADKAITDLTQATQITGDDLFVLEQSGEAKKLKGSQVVQYAKDAVAEEVQGVKEYAGNAKTSADAAAASAAKAASAAQGIDAKVAAVDASAKAAASSAAAAAASATGVDEKVQAAQTAADNAAKSETAAKNAQTGAANAQKAAETAQTGAQDAKTAAESAQEAAESAKDAAAGSSTAAGQKASQAAQSAEDAASAKSAAETAKTDAQAARDAIVNMIVDAVTLETGKPATVSKSLVDNVYKLVFGLPRGETGATGPQGATGNGISGIALKSGNHAPGTSDVYTITLTDGTTFDFEVYNGANGQGAGDMLASVYDPQGKRTDVYKYVDDEIAKIPTPDVSAQIKAHNESETAHPYILGLIPTKTSQLDNDSGYLTQHQDLSGKLDKTGDGSEVTAAFTAATTRANIATGEKLSVLFGKIAKWLADLGSLAFKSTVAKSDLEGTVQSLLLPDGGTTGQVVTKTADGQEWADAAGGDAFWVTYDDTALTGQMIVDAINANKNVYCRYKGQVFGLALNGVPIHPNLANYVFFPVFGIPVVKTEENDDGNSVITSVYQSKNQCLLFQDFDNSGLGRSWSAINKAQGFVPEGKHAVQHKKGGVDAISPSDIGAIASDSLPSTASILKTDGSGGLAAATPETDYASPVFMRKVTLTTAGWNSSTKQQTVACTGILADATKQEIFPNPVDTSYDNAWDTCGIKCVAQGANSLTFQCSEIPTVAVDVYATVITLSYKG